MLGELTSGQVTLWMEALHAKSPPCMFGVHWSSAGGDITYLICHVISQEHVIVGYDVISWSFSLYVILSYTATFGGHRHSGSGDMFLVWLKGKIPCALS